MGINNLSGFTPELLAGLSGVVPDDYGLATSLYLSSLAKEYNIKLAESLGIDVSTPEKYRNFVRSNPNAYKHPILKHQLGYGLLDPTIGGMIQAHVIKNKINRLQSMDSSEFNNENGRFLNMFKEFLQAYSTCEDKTNFLAGQVPEEVRPELLAALDMNDETKFNTIMDSINGTDAVDELTESAVEPNESEIQMGDQPEVADTVADENPDTITPVPEEVAVNDGTLPEGDVGTMLSEEQLEMAMPTLENVANMTEQVQNLENTDGIPENLKEGVEIWKDADEDFSIKIVAETVRRLHKGDFSEEKDISEGEILRTGAEVAKELHDKGEHKTSLTKGIEEVETDLKVLDLAELYSVLGELRNLKESVINFVDFIAEKDDLGLSPSKKAELVDEILNEGIFVDGTDNLKSEVAETLNSSADYSAKDMATRLSIFKDFSEGFDEHMPELSDVAGGCIQCAADIQDSQEPQDAPAEATDEATDEVEPVSEETIEIADKAGTVDKAIELVENRIEELQQDEKVVDGFAEFSMDCAVQVAKANNIDPDAYLKLIYGTNVNRTPYQNLVIKKMYERERDYLKPKFLGGPGSRRYAKKYGNIDNTSTQIAYVMPELLKRYGYDPTVGDIMISESLHRGQNFSEEGDFGLGTKIAAGLLGLGAGASLIVPGAMTLNNVDVATSPQYKQAVASYLDTDAKLRSMDTVNPYVDTVNNINKDIDSHSNNLNMYKDELANLGTFQFGKKNTYKDLINKENQTLENLGADLEKATDDKVAWDKNTEATKTGYEKTINDIKNSTNPKLFEKALAYESGKASPKSDTMAATAQGLVGVGLGATGAGLALEEALNKKKRLARVTGPKRDRKIAKAVKRAFQGKDSSMNKKDFAEGEAPVEEQLPKEVIDNALSNDDQIRALVEKYKMLPTVEAKEQMKADMQTLGFTDEVIQMIEQYAEGNFSEGEEAPAAEVCPNCGQDPCVCEAPAEEPEVDVASMVSPELFDNLLGFENGPTDPVDGTLVPGEVEAPGTELGHLGTLDQGIPAGEPVPEDDKEVAKVQIVNSDPEVDDFDSIMR